MDAFTYKPDGRCQYTNEPYWRINNGRGPLDDGRVTLRDGGLSITGTPWDLTPEHAQRVVAAMAAALTYIEATRLPGPWIVEEQPDGTGVMRDSRGTTMDIDADTMMRMKAQATLVGETITAAGRSDGDNGQTPICTGCRRPILDGTPGPATECRECRP